MVESYKHSRGGLPRSPTAEPHSNKSNLEDGEGEGRGGRRGGGNGEVSEELQ